MEFFQTLCKIYRAIGIYPVQPNQYYSLNARNMMILILGAWFFVAIVLFILYDANNVVDFAELFFQALSAFICSIQFSLCFWQIPNILNLMKRFDEFVEISKFK